MLVNSGGRIPKILMQNDPAFTVEAQLRDTLGNDGLSTGEVFRADFHRPTGIDIRSGDRDILEAGGNFLGTARRFEQILFHRLDPDLSRDSIVEPCIGGIGFSHQGLDVLLAEVPVKRGETLHGPLGRLVAP